MGFPGFPVVNAMPVCFSDTELTFIADDGHEMPITNVTRVDWRVKQGSEPAEATLHFDDVDVELEVDLSPLEHLEQAGNDWAYSKKPASGPNATERLAELAEKLIARKRGAQ
jgi:hypothetical protein